jgi:alkanesulfonate monooxygenase SsuD/methylene tetrahydromethanopterin reductase-like flavin-dependent oxidoreductase (luciferase family)
MRIGVLLLPTDPWAETVDLARRLEQMGYAHLWTYDHLSWRRYRDQAWHATFPWLTGLAAATSSIRLGTMVSAPTIRHPVLLAKDAMTVDHISGGRFTLGLGSGGTGFDAEVFGEPLLSPAQSADRLREFVEVTDQLLSQPATSYSGTYFTVHEARMLPGCVQKPRLPLAVAAAGPRALAVTARHADAWITYGDRAHLDSPPAGIEQVVRDQADRLAAHCADIGRDPGEIDRIYLVGNTAERPLASVDAFADFAGRYRELGFTDIVFHHPRRDDPIWNDDPVVVEEIAAEVLPRLR